MQMKAMGAPPGNEHARISKMQYDTIIVEKEAGIGQIVLNRPQQMLEQLLKG